MANSKQLGLPEELLLVALDDERGTLLPTRPFALELAVAAALIMELTLARRLDTDPNRVFVTSGEPTGDPLLDEALASIVAEGATLGTADWLRRLASTSPPLPERIIDRLVQRGVLRSQEKRLLWVFKTRAYPPTSGLEEKEVRSRVMTLLNNSDIPDPRDALLIGLLKACGILELLLSEIELQRLQSRIDQIVNLEEVNRALADVVTELQILMASVAMHP